MPLDYRKTYCSRYYNLIITTFTVPVSVPLSASFSLSFFGPTAIFLLFFHLIIVILLLLLLFLGDRCLEFLLLLLRTHQKKSVNKKCL